MRILSQKLINRFHKPNMNIFYKEKFGHVAMKFVHITSMFVSKKYIYKLVVQSNCSQIWPLMEDVFKGFPKKYNFLPALIM